MTWLSSGALARRSLMVLWDAVGWLLAIAFVVITRYEFYLSDAQWSSILMYALLACAAQFVVGTLLKLYRGKYRVGTFEESLGLVLSMIVVALFLAVAFLGIPQLEPFPRGVAFLAPPIALLLAAAGRLAFRAWYTSRRPRVADAEKVLIYGAGDAGYQLVRLMKADTNSPYEVVGLVDDDRAKRNLSLLGAPVIGGRESIVPYAQQHGVSAVILAISAATSEMIREITDVAEEARLKFFLLPPVSQILGGRVRLSDVREVDIADLLGRRQIDTDIESIAGYLTNKRVLVTGAGGSIGSELARQVRKFGPAELVMLDRDESALHGVQLSIYGKALLDTPDLVLASIRDRAALFETFEAHRPEVVFHAAALKHLPMLEQYPDEGWKTNVVGTQNLLELAAEFGVEKFVNISTDKAANPTSVLGKTKQRAEQLTAWYGQQSAGTYISVRFGNVLGSRGSMLLTFREQIAQGGPVTVTHPEVTRYFMTIPEASELVIQAGAIGQDGEVLVLDMGEPVKIIDVARRLINYAGDEVEIVFTGLRSNEKLHEDLFSSTEMDLRHHHPLISHVRVEPRGPEDLQSPSMAPPSVGNGRSAVDYLATVDQGPSKK